MTYKIVYLAKSDKLFYQCLSECYKMEWRITNNRFIAFFDIMGFKNLVQTHRHQDVLNLMKKIADFVQIIDSNGFKSRGSRTEIKTVIFSDSIVLMSNNDTIGSAINVMVHSSLLYQFAMSLKIPLKACISHGKFSADFNKSVFFGQPLIDAYLLQEEMNLYSIVLHHSFEKKLGSKKYSGLTFYESPRWIKHMTPFKGGKSNHYHLNWLFYDIEFDSKSPERVKKIEENLNDFYCSLSGKTRAYVDNTLILFEKMIKHTS